MSKIGLLGGSFNPAHVGHRHISLFALQALGLDEVWWLVSPGNPLKPRADMAPLVVRMTTARAQARRARIKVTAIESKLHTRYTVDTLAVLQRRFPNNQFIWLMGADNLAQFHRWHWWRKIAQKMPIAVLARPCYDGQARHSVAAHWLRAFVHPADQAKRWTVWRRPALVYLRFPPNQTAATAIRRASPHWLVDARSAAPLLVRPRDPLTHQHI